MQHRYFVLYFSDMMQFCFILLYSNSSCCIFCTLADFSELQCRLQERFAITFLFFPHVFKFYLKTLYQGYTEKKLVVKWWKKKTQNQDDLNKGQILQLN